MERSFRERDCSRFWARAAQQPVRTDRSPRNSLSGLPAQLTAAQLADYQLQVTRRGHAQELQKIVSQTSELKDGLVDLTKKLPQIGAGQDREIAEDLATLHHQLSDLRAHVEIARREVALAKRVGQGEKGVGRGSIRFLSGNGFLRGVQGARIGERRGVERVVDPVPAKGET